MIDSQFRRRLMRGDLLLGTIVTLNSPEIVEILADIGFDWLFIDAEHAPFSALDMQRLLQATGSEISSLIRVSGNDEVVIKKALDIGAAGVIVPQVNNAGDAQSVVRAAKYAPQGARGAGISRAHSYGLRFNEYVSTVNDSISIVVQVEHIDAVENIEEIVEVPGVDAVFIGPFDLSASMGKLGQVDDPDVKRAIRRVQDTCTAAGMPLGIFGLTADAVEGYIASGFTLIVAGVDTLLLSSAAAELLHKLKQTR